jgi:2-keto-4-pentenoate hydratase/2-oxohepta-3-ene-1,7-dioic acid hydratase in catechol pathway
MKLVTIADERGGRPGLVHGDQIFDLRVGHPALSLSGWRPNSVITVMDAGEAGRDHLLRLSEALAAADDSECQVLRAQGALLPLAGTRLAPPIRRSGLIVVLEQPDDGLPQPFLKSANTLVGPDAQLHLPQHLGGLTTVVGQIAVVLARPGHRLSAAEAHSAIGGFVLAMDLTHQSEPQDGGGAARLLAQTLGKQMPGFYPMGPYLLTGDQFDAEAVQAQLTINGVAASHWQADDLLPRAQEALVWLSRYFSFKPGDVVALSGPGTRGAAVGPGDAIRWCSPLLGDLMVHVSL